MRRNSDEEIKVSVVRGKTVAGQARSLHTHEQTPVVIGDKGAVLVNFK